MQAYPVTQESLYRQALLAKNEISKRPPWLKCEFEGSDLEFRTYDLPKVRGE